MSGTLSEQSSLANLAQYSEPHWYASYTCSRREKRVAEVLRERGVECFLPLYEKVHRYPRELRKVQLPLFPGYLFVHIALADRLCVLEAPGVVQLVSFHGHPAPLNDSEIDAMRRGLSEGVKAQPYPYIKIGHPVEIKSGPLRGLHGKVLRRNSHLRVILSVDLLFRSVVMDVDAADLSPVQVPRLLQ